MSASTGVAPLATVVVTTHDRPELADRALGSALAQTLADIEVVVVDDGSHPPFTPSLDDPRCSVIRNEDPAGVTAARNRGLAVARGAWITFLDDDDLLVPEMLERSIAAAEASGLPQPVAANAAVVVVDPDGSEATTLVPAPALSRGDDYFLEQRGAAGRSANSLVVPTAVLRAIGGFDERFETFEHHDLGLRLNAVASIQGIDAPLYRMTTHRGPRLSERRAAIPTALERTLAEHAAAFARHPAARAFYMGTIGYYHLQAGHWGDALRWCARGVVGNPRDLRLWLFLAAALAGPWSRAAYRRIRPPEATVSTWELTKARARKHGRRLANYPRAAVGAPLAAATDRLLRRVGRAPVAAGPRSVLFLCIYRERNAPHVSALVAEALARGWDVRLWALDHAAPGLAASTVGFGPGAKFPLLNQLARGQDAERFDWVVVADDDLAFVRGSVDDLLSVAEAADLDLVQPAHVELSYRENEITVRRPLSVARRTTFVEIGPIFAFRRPWIGRILPFPPEHTMGWGLELDWFDLERTGARLGIVDAVPIRHLHPVGKGYAKDEQRARLEELLVARGLASVHEIQRVEGTWRPWRPRPPWAPGPRLSSGPAVAQPE